MSGFTWKDSLAMQEEKIAALTDRTTELQDQVRNRERLLDQDSDRIAALTTQVEALRRERDEARQLLYEAQNPMLPDGSTMTIAEMYSAWQEDQAALREAVSTLRFIYSHGPVFDAKGTWSMQMCEEAGKTLALPAIRALETP